MHHENYDHGLNAFLHSYPMQFLKIGFAIVE